jgi:hypothetical protein
MSDNSQITSGTGDLIRDKDRAGVKTQIFGLDLGIGTGTESLMSGIMPSGNIQTRISVTPTVSTTPAYAVKDAVGGLLTFSNAARASGGSIILQSVVVIDASQQMPALDLVLFDRTFTNSTDNAIFAPSDTDLAFAVGVIPISNWADFSTNSVATRFGLGHNIKLNGTDLFGQLVTRSTPTFVATTDLTIILGLLQD